MKKLLCMAIAVIVQGYCSNFSFSQNLVINPSFEDHTQCPDSWNRIHYATGWFQPNTFNGNTSNSSSTDYYNECTNSLEVDVPDNSLGFQYARTGSAYAGIFSYDNNGLNFREYIEGQLLQPLEEGKRYCVSFYVSLADEMMYGINMMGINFSPDKVLYSDVNFYCLPLTPHVKNPETNIITDTANWVLISGYYFATGQEEYITIGNFVLNESTDTVFVKDSAAMAAYYYVDDVSVVLCDTIINPPDTIKINEFDLYPNPTLGELTLEWKLKQEMPFNVFITDVAGRRVEKYYFPTSTIGKEVIDLSNFANGVYILNVRGEGMNEHFKIIKQ